MKSIESKTFSGCTKLSSISFPSTLKTIGYQALLNTAWLNAQADGIVYITPNSSTNKIAYIVKGTSTATSMTLNSNTIAVSAGFLKGNTSIQSVTIPEGCLTIGAGAFYGCTNLSSATLPNSLTTIGGSMPVFGGGAFQNCTSLASIILPSNLTTIDRNAFNGCIGLNSIKLVSGIAVINSSAFTGCTGLTSIDFPSSVTSIGADIFSSCTGITKAIMRLTALPTNSNLFSDVNSLGANAKVYVYDDKYTTLAYDADGVNPPSPSMCLYFNNMAKAGRLYKFFSTPTAETSWGEKTITSGSKSFSVQNETESGSTTYYYRTACRNYPFIVPSGVTAYQARISSTAVTLVEETSTDADGNKVVPAGRGVVIRTTDPTALYDFLETKADVTASDYASNVLLGLTATPTTLTAGEYMTLGYETGSGELGFWKNTSDNNIDAGSAYIPASALPAGSKGFVIGGGDDPTGISSAVNDSKTPVYYNLQGQRVNNPSKGIYISAGKKVYVK